MIEVKKEELNMVDALCGLVEGKRCNIVSVLER